MQLSRTLLTLRLALFRLGGEYYLCPVSCRVLAASQMPGAPSSLAVTTKKAHLNLPGTLTLSRPPPPSLQHSSPFTTHPARLLEVLLLHAHPRRPAWPYFPHLCPISPPTPTQRFCFLRAWILLIFPLSPLHHPTWSLAQTIVSRLLSTCQRLDHRLSAT